MSDMENQPTMSQAPTRTIQATSRRGSRRGLGRDAVVAAICGVVVVLFFAVTMVKGPAVLVRPM